MATPVYTNTDSWGRYEREGYSDHTKVVAYAPAKAAPSGRSFDLIRAEEWIASLGACGALLWSAHIVSDSLPNLNTLWETPGPLETCSIAAIIWLHAKWRRAVRVK